MCKAKTINDITVEQVSAAAELNAEQYETMFKKAAKAAFIEGVLWAQEISRKEEQA